MATQQWSKAQKLLNHHQVKMIISRVTEVQGSNLLVTARKSTSYNNETILLGDHHRLPPPTHFGVRHSRNGMVSAPFHQLQKPRGGSKCAYTDIVSIFIHYWVPSPSFNCWIYKSERAFVWSPPSTYLLGQSSLYNSRQMDFLILHKGDLRAQA